MPGYLAVRLCAALRSVELANPGIDFSTKPVVAVQLPLDFERVSESGALLAGESHPEFAPDRARGKRYCSFNSSWSFRNKATLSNGIRPVGNSSSLNSVSTS